MACLFQSLAEFGTQMKEDASLRGEAIFIALNIVTATSLAWFYYRWWSRHPLYGQNRGPKIYPITGSLITFLRNRSNLLDFNAEMLRSVPTQTFRGMRPWRKYFFITGNPANVEHMLRTNFANYPKGQWANENLRQLLGDGIFNADDEMWRFQRKVASHEFTTRSLSDFWLESAKQECKERMVPVLSQAAQSGTVLDLQDILARFAFDNICQLGFGVDPACLDPSLPEVKFARAFDKATELMAKKMQSWPKFGWKLGALLDVGRPRELRLAVATVNEFSMGVIAKRRQELAKEEEEGRGGDRTAQRKEDLLSRFMAKLNTEEENINGGKLSSSISSSSSDAFLRDIIISFVLAGRDTSTGALSWFFWLLSTHPHVERAILEEIRNVRSSSSSTPTTTEEHLDHGEDFGSSSSSFSYQELKSMHYLTSALMESMRLYPPVPADYKTARAADVLPDGTVIPANAAVAYHPYAMGRLEQLWGEDCLEFRPERWLNDQGVFVPQSPYKYAVFQAGPRICLGKDLVMMQMKEVCVAILSNFKISVPQEYTPKPRVALTLRIKDGLPVTVQKRNNTENFSPPSSPLK